MEKERRMKILLEGDEIEQVEDFKFFRSSKTTNGDWIKTIKKRIAIAKAKAAKLSKVWMSRIFHGS